MGFKVEFREKFVVVTKAEEFEMLGIRESIGKKEP